MRKLILLLSLWSATLAASEMPMIVDPVVNATPPGSKVTAGYLTLMNHSDKDIIINSIYSPTIAKVEMHLSSVKNDVATMEKQETLTIKAGETLEFTHGSYHLMFMELSEPLEENDIVDVILNTSIGEMLIEMPVKKPGKSKDSMDHGEMKISEKLNFKRDEHAGTDEAKHGDMKKDGAAHTQTTKNVN